MKEFTYSGPANGFAFATKGKIVWEGMLHDGQIVKLPEDHPQVEALVTAKRLVPADIKAIKTGTGTAPSTQAKED